MSKYQLHTYSAVCQPGTIDRHAYDYGALFLARQPRSRCRGRASTFHASALSPMHVRTREWHGWARTSVDGVLCSFPSTDSPLTL